ncbi:MAG: hypothetical protein ABFD10_11650 [Prolixibacteraceae bacterium]
MTKVFFYTRMLILLAAIGGFGACDDKDEVPRPESFRVTGEIYGNGSPVSGIYVEFETRNAEGTGYAAMDITGEDGLFDIVVNDLDGTTQFSIKTKENVEGNPVQYENKEITISLNDFTVIDGKASKNLGRIELTRRTAN